MTSRIWPPLSEADKEVMFDNSSLELCGDCECDPCQCDLCGECECDPCECYSCEMCGHGECECPHCYVIYTTKVVVGIDSDGNIASVAVASDLDGVDHVEDEDGNILPSGNPYYERALYAASNNEWPSWTIE